MDKFISIVVPVYNEEENLYLLYGSLKNILSTCGRDYEIIFVDDGSTDDSLSILQKLSVDDSRIKLIEFSRNFGKEAAISAGLFFATGNGVILIDADLQHPPELIPQFLGKWEAGADLVIGVREKNQGESLVKKLGSSVFYKIMKWIGETKTVPRATDYRLLDRKVVDEFNRLTERNRITRGLIDWLGFKKDYIYFTANKRNGGRTGYSYSKLTKLALSSFVSHSLFPLKLAGYLGITITFFSAILGLFVFSEKYLLNDPWHLYFSGPALLAILILFLIGIVLTCLGLIALYIANIHSEVSNRPLYIIRDKKI